MRTAGAGGRTRRGTVALALVVLAGGLLLGRAPASAAQRAAASPAGSSSTATIAPGFQESTVWSGLTRPTAIRFAADGRVFVSEKRGAIKIFDSLSDTTPTTFTGLTTNVHDFWDRGLLGMALDPSLTGGPGPGTGSYVYVLYSYDHILGDPNPAPRWGDLCPNPPGSVTDGCVISGRLSRFEVTGSAITGAEQVLVEGWCQQGPSHSLGALHFGTDGSLYASAGDGAKFTLDYGQHGGSTTPVITPKNPCGDPPGGVGGSMTPPTAEGGSLRSQDIRTPADPQALNGTIIRVNPATGAGVAGSPFAGSGDANARRIIAYGLRNPFRFAPRPGTNELWIGDVGWDTWEEIDRIPNLSDNVAENFGWPCYEGAPKQPVFDGTNLNLCESLYSQGAGAVVAPYFPYRQSNKITQTETCPVGDASVTGMTFYPEAGGSFPGGYAGGLFFADHTRNCIWFMPKGANGQPNTSNIQLFIDGAANPVDVAVGPGGDLYYVDFDGGSIRKVIPTGGNIPPTAAMQVSPLSGPAPLTVSFASAGSFDPEGTALTYGWELDGDADFDDATTASVQRTYTEPANLTVGLRVTDGAALSTTITKSLSVANDPPVPVMAAPLVGRTWRVGELISFTGSATDAQDGALPAAKLDWSLRIQHCSTPSSCHPHDVQSWAGVASGSFFAPDHEYPSYLELTLTATDSLGVARSVTRRLDPKTVTLTFKSVPSAMSIVMNSAAFRTAFSKTVIVGSANAVAATSPQTYNGAIWTFKSWSDGKAGSHTIVGPTTSTTYTATFQTPSKFFRTTADAQVRAAWPSSNYGGSTLLRVRSGQSRAYLKFSVTGLSGAASSAKLRIWVTNGSPGGGSIYRVSNAWTESGITWGSAPAISGSPRSTLGAVTTGTWVEFNLGALIAGNGTYSFAIAGGVDDSADYASRETTRDAYLVVTP